LHSLWVVADGFFDYNSPKPERIWIKSGNISEGPRCALTQKWGNRPRGSAYKSAKTCFILSRNEGGFLAIYSAPISTFFETKDVNKSVCTCVYTRDKFPNCYMQEVFQATETTKRGNFEGVLVIGIQLKWHNFRR